MRVEVAIDEARQYIGQGDFAQARDVLAPYRDHPKAQYWLKRIEKSEKLAAQGIVADRWFTFRWDFVVAAAIISVFALIIVIIGITA
ncbi:MAG: hypothetical protein CUN55_17595 [Phototrophicales bacterium]|nr:MAG: hypothetical protein CUN55_17595 [Phototrophicales bacterium]